MRSFKKDHTHLFKDLGKYQWCEICGTLRTRTRTGSQKYFEPRKLKKEKQVSYLESLTSKGITTKNCCECKKEKPFPAFGKETQNFDGLRNMCRECYSKQYYEKDRFWKVDHQKKYNTYTPHRKIKRFLRPDQYKAQNMARDAIKKGEIDRPDECSECGKKCKPNAHHQDYSKPLDVIWLCRQCHMRLHREEREIA